MIDKNDFLKVVSLILVGTLSILVMIILQIQGLLDSKLILIIIMIYLFFIMFLLNNG